jgi:hypothetical protein
VKASERLTNSIIRAEPITGNRLDENGWELFFNNAISSGLGPAFYLHVKDLPSLPQKIRTKSHSAYKDALLFKDLAVCSLKELSHNLSRSGRVVLLKGLALCENIYTEPLIRSMSDVDLYFPDGSINEVRNVFLRNGYTSLDASGTVMCKNGLHIDLHEDLWNARRIAQRTRCIPDLHESFEPSSLVPGFFIPSPSLLAEHSAYHAIKHCFSRRLWYLDLVFMHKAGYFKEPYDMSLIALDQCSRMGFIHGTFSKPRVASYKRILLHSLFSTNESPGKGELALALSLPRLYDSLLYIVESIIPRKEILIEMYGDRPFIFLFFRRIFVIASYAIGMLSCKKNR